MYPCVVGEVGHHGSPGGDGQRCGKDSGLLVVRLWGHTHTFVVRTDCQTLQAVQLGPLHLADVALHHDGHGSQTHPCQSLNVWARLGVDPTRHCHALGHCDRIRRSTHVCAQVNLVGGAPDAPQLLERVGVARGTYLECLCAPDVHTNSKWHDRVPALESFCDFHCTSKPVCLKREMLHCTNHGRGMRGTPEGSLRSINAPASHTQNSGHA